MAGADDTAFLRVAIYCMTQNDYTETVWAIDARLVVNHDGSRVLVLLPDGPVADWNGYSADWAQPHEYNRGQKA